MHLRGRTDPPALLALLRYLRLDRPWVILDLAEVPELDLATLAVLARTQRRLHRHRAHLALYRTRAQHRQLIAERCFHRIAEIITGDLGAWLAHRSPPAGPRRTPPPAPAGAGGPADTKPPADTGPREDTGPPAPPS